MAPVPADRPRPAEPELGSPWNHSHGQLSNDATGFASCYGPLSRSHGKGFRHWASTPRVSPRRRQSATGPPGSYPDRTHTGKRRRADDNRSTAYTVNLLSCWAHEITSLILSGWGYRILQVSALRAERFRPLRDANHKQNERGDDDAHPDVVEAVPLADLPPPVQWDVAGRPLGDPRVDRHEQHDRHHHAHH
jgi:hypothetical protein